VPSGGGAGVVAPFDAATAKYVLGVDAETGLVTLVRAETLAAAAAQEEEEETEEEEEEEDEETEDETEVEAAAAPADGRTDAERAVIAAMRK
jgi:hypothetical protein